MFLLWYIIRVDVLVLCKNTKKRYLVRLVYSIGPLTMFTLVFKVGHIYYANQALLPKNHSIAQTIDINYINPFGLYSEDDDDLMSENSYPFRYVLVIIPSETRSFVSSISWDGRWIGGRKGLRTINKHPKSRHVRITLVKCTQTDFLYYSV